METEPYRTSVDIAAPPDRIYPYLTQPENILTWMGDHAVLDPTPGGEFSLDINGIPVRGRYLELDPPYRVVISWGHAGSTILPPGASTVEINLTPIPGGTRVSLVHRNLPPEEAQTHAVGWPHFVKRLATAASGGNPGPDPFATATPTAPNQ